MWLKDKAAIVGIGQLLFAKDLGPSEEVTAHERGYTSRHLGWIAAACRRHATNNPIAMMREPITETNR